MFYGGLVYVFHDVFFTSLLGILRFSSVVNECLWIVSCTLVVMLIRGVIVHTSGFSVWMRGLDFVGFFSYGIVGEYVMTVGEFYELCDFW